MSDTHLTAPTRHIDVDGDRRGTGDPLVNQYLFRRSQILTTQQ